MRLSAHRVAVTGIGMLTPLGCGREETWRALLDGAVGTGPITRFDAATFSSRIAAQIDDFDPARFMDAKRIRWTDRFSQLAVAAAREAVDDAAFPVRPDASDVGIWIGSALGGLAYADEQHDVFRERGIAAVKPLLAISVFGGAATCNVAIEFGICGPTVANANSCASGAVAIGDAFRAIARGDVRAALAGGVEAPLAPLVFGAFTVIRAMSTRNDDPLRASRPFDRERDGFVMAEGAAVMVLERLDDALSRGARVYGEVLGYGLGNDAHHMTAPRSDGAVAARAIQGALREAALQPGEIELVSAHGSATVLGDRVEAKALATALGDALQRIPLMATKGQHGHALGATGAWEAALSLLSIERGVIPRAVGIEHVDPECAAFLPPFPGLVERRTIRTALSNTAGFGGINAALVFGAV